MSLFILRSDVEALRQQASAGDEKAAAVLSAAKVVDGPPQPCGVSESLIGSEIIAEVNGKRQRYVIGGCLIPDAEQDPDRVPYMAPIVPLLYPAEPGAYRAGTAAGRHFRVHIVEVHLAPRSSRAA